MTSERSPADSLALRLATLFGAGRSPFVPGTVGTLVSLLPAYILGRYLPLWGFGAATAFVALLGVWAGGRAADLLGQKDPGAVVIDETAGLFVTLFGIPAGPVTLAAAFVLFRVMDILKPPPARRLERLRGGWGIVADDLMAGFYANLALRVLRALTPGLPG